ncbi:PKD domain-containing protein [Pseudoalteromonas sp. T1lg48]|uniref:PKD domain-containing protein n=1 Tax=Pseudoalteromonas sp. T1lg48 TaxID=2077100 RepID=UPI001319F224|nr:hypothetical protein [Pseudoalteromonas sp. T1lg48]
MTGCNDDGHVSIKVEQPTVSSFGVDSSEAGVQLDWVAVKGATNYEVFRCPVPEGRVNGLCEDIDVSQCGTALVKTPQLTYFDVPPTAPAAFCYSIRPCFDGDGQECGAHSKAKAGVHRLSAEERPERFLEAYIGDDGRHTYTGQKTTLHSFLKNKNVLVGKATYQWRVIGGSGGGLTLKTSDLENPDYRSVSFIAPSTPGRVDIEVRVSDNRGVTDTAKAAIYIRNHEAPVLTQTTSNRVVQAGAETALSVQASSINGPLSYMWTQISPDPTVLPITLDDPNSSNPKFIVPDVFTSSDGVTSTLAKGNIVFKVQVTDSTGETSTSEVALQVHQPVEATTKDHDSTTTSGDGAAKSKPSGKPLSVALPVVHAVLPPLAVEAMPATSNLAGEQENLAVAVTGGKEPYTYSWTQVGGTEVLGGLPSDQAKPSVELPKITTAEDLHFKVEVIDSKGKKATAQLVVTVQPSKAVVTPEVPQPVINKPFHITAGDSGDLYTSLEKVQVFQTAGTELTVEGISALESGQTRIRISAPLLKVDSATAQLLITGVKGGREISQVQPVKIFHPTDTGKAETEPTVVTTTPNKYKELVLSEPGLLSATEGQEHVQLAVSVMGGEGPYLYAWTYKGDVNDPDITLLDETTRTPSFSLTDVDVPVDVVLHFQVAVNSADGQSRTLPLDLVVKNITEPVRWKVPSVAQRETASSSLTDVPLSVSLHGDAGNCIIDWTQELTGVESELVVPFVGGSEHTPSPRIDLSAVPADKASSYHFRGVVECPGGQRDEALLSLMVSAGETHRPVVPPADPLSVASMAPVTVLSGHAAYLHAPSPVGGVGPYRMNVVQEAGDSDQVTITPVQAGTWQLTDLPDVTAGPKQLNFTFVIHDRNGGEVHVTQQVKVVSQLTEFIADISAPPGVLASDRLEMLAIAGGGSGNYTFQWTITPIGLDDPDSLPMDMYQCVNEDGTPCKDAPLVVPPLPRSASGNTASFFLWEAPDDNDPDYSVNVLMTATDITTGKSFEVRRTIQINNRSYLENYLRGTTEQYVPKYAARPGSECVLCGDRDHQDPCSDLDLILGMTIRCPDTHPYCMNDVRVDYDGVTNTGYWIPELAVSNGLQVTQYRRCVSEEAAFLQWYLDSKTRPECQEVASADAHTRTSEDNDNGWGVDFSIVTPENQVPGVECHLACYGDSCNLDSNPPPETLFGLDKDGNPTPTSK